MELLYVWIKEYKNIENRGFNFGGEYLFEFDGKALTYEKNPQYIEGFFNLDEEGANITNVTGVVGKNGAGKSSLLSFIIPRLAEGIHEKTDFNECIVILKEDQNIKVFHHKKYDYIKNIIEQIDSYRVQYSNSFENLVGLDLIYYNPGFHDTVDFSVKGVHNISTRTLLEKEDPVTYSNDNANSSNITLAEALNRHELLEGIRKVNFLKVEDEYNFDIKSGFANFFVIHLKKIGVSESKARNDFNYRLSQAKSEKYEELYKNHHYSIINPFFTKLEDGNYIRENKDYFKLLLYRALIYHSIHDAKREPKTILNELDKIDLSSNILDQIKQILISSFQEVEYEIIQEKKVSYPFPKNEQYGIRVEQVLNQIDNFLTEIEPIRDNRGSINLFIEIKNNSKEIKDFLKAYFSSIVLTTQYLYFDYSHSQRYKTILSTGEERYLSMVSRFFSLTDDELFGDNNKLKQNIIVFLDETELYFHPEWQQDFIRLLLDFLPKIYQSDTNEYPRRNIQIVLTSHSPFIVSDLPSSKVLFLKSKNGQCEIDKSDKKSFGANIHHLFKSAFFLDKGLVGKFAEEKIKEVLRWLDEIKEKEMPLKKEGKDWDDQKQKAFEEEKKKVILHNKNRLSKMKEEREGESKGQMLKTIQLIDEPILANKLEQMYIDRMGIENVDKDMREKIFEERAAMLRKQLGLD